MSRSIIALIPALDEEASLPGVLRALAREGVSRVVVADNGSTDRTADVARAAGADVVRAERRGYGAACLAGLARIAALPERPVAVVFVDADQAVERGSIARLTVPVLAGDADLVLGVRSGSGARAPGTILPHARVGNRFVLWLVRLLFGQRYRDLPPFRAIRLSALDRLEMDDRDWGWTLQMQLRAGVEGLRVVEVPVEHTARTAGRSKISGSLIGSIRAGRKMIWTVFRERWLASPLARGRHGRRGASGGRPGRDDRPDGGGAGTR